ncbi:MAG: TQO small subunit DoxD [Bacteroidota bacterium]
MNSLSKAGGQLAAQSTRFQHQYLHYALIGLRWVIGWLFFSALWRRVVLAPKLDPELPGYVGHKFNHFLPGAIGIDGMIEFLVTHPDWLHGFLIVFTIIEGLVGLALLLGLLTRLSAFGVLLLSGGILLGAGWLGTTCLDEWQIGMFGMAGAWVLMLGGSGPQSIDGWLMQRYASLSANKTWRWLASGPLPFGQRAGVWPVVGISVLMLFATLATNQIFHGGVWGKLHNDSAKPHLYATAPKLSGNTLTFVLGRDKGPDSYGGFLYRIALLDADGQVLHSAEPRKGEPGGLQITRQHYLNTVQFGPNSVHVPLGGAADVRWELPPDVPLSRVHALSLENIGGMRWQYPLD